MEKCSFCEATHPHPRGGMAIKEGWSVAEAEVETNKGTKKILLIACPKHFEQFKRRLEEEIENHIRGIA